MKKLIYTLIILQVLAFSSCSEKKTEETGSAENQVLNNHITITQEQFDKAMETLNTLDEDGFSPEENEARSEKEEEQNEE